VETSAEEARTSDVTCIDRGEVCPTISPAELTKTLCIGLGCPAQTEDSNTPPFYYIIGGAVGGMVILSVLVVLTLLFLCFVKLKKSLKMTDSYEGNPIYESAGEV